MESRSLMTAEGEVRKRAKAPPIEDGALDSLILAPNPSDPALAKTIEITNEKGEVERVRAVRERPLTIFLNDQEIVTAMTVGDFPEVLALGYLINQGMLRLVVDNGEIETRVTFETEGFDLETSQSSKFKSSKFGVRGGGGVSAKIFNLSASGGLSRTKVATSSSRELHSTTTNVELFGRVKIDFHTDYLPLNPA